MHGPALRKHRLRRGLGSAASDQVPVDDERALLAKDVGRQGQLQADDEAPQHIGPLAALPALPCMHGPAGRRQ